MLYLAWNYYFYIRNSNTINAINVSSTSPASGLIIGYLMHGCSAYCGNN